MAKTHIEVAGVLRERINDGLYPPGSRLPIRLELEEELASSSHTVQRALGQLIAEGYVVTRGKAGSFVAENPPHLSRICLFSPFALEQATGFSRFYRSVVESLPAVERKLGVSFEILDAADHPANWARVQKLVDDVHLQRLAGILFLAGPGHFAGSPIYDAPAVARGALSNQPVFDIPAVTTDVLAFYRRALEYLARQGCRRPAVVVDALTAGQEPEPFPALFRQFELEFRPELLLTTLPGNDRFFERLIRLWRHLPAAARPDALVINDDNCLERITAVLKELDWLRETPPRVVALANFPWVSPVHSPVTFLGYETGRTLEICTRNILARSRGEKIPALTRLPARFEYELPPADARAAQPIQFQRRSADE